MFAFRNKTNNIFNINRILLRFLFAYLWTNLNSSVLHSNIYMLLRTQYNTVLQTDFFQAQLLTMENVLINCSHVTTKYTVWEDTELWYTFKDIRWYTLLVVQIKSELICLINLILKFLNSVLLQLSCCNTQRKVALEVIGSLFLCWNTKQWMN